MVRAAKAEFGELDILVNNAGVQHVESVEKFPTDKWEQIIAINLSAAFYATRAAVPGMKARKWGRIINTASAHALVASPFKSAYVAAKHGVVGLTRALALEYAKTGITVNAVCPGYTETEIVKTSIDRVVAKTGRTPEQAMAEFVKSNPQGRLVQPHEVADAVLWLCGRGASSITGQAIAVAGGEVM